MSPSAAAVSLVEPSHFLPAGCWTAESDLRFALGWSRASVPGTGIL